MTTNISKFPEKGRKACLQVSARLLIYRRPADRSRPRLDQFRKILLSLFLLSFLPLSASAVRVIEAGAIPFTAFLSKADFDQRYPGKEMSDLSTLEPGWYVIYEHESLSYYFGPVLLESTGQDYLAQLTDTVEAAVAQRPSIQDYRVELSYEPSQSSSPSGSTAGSSSSGGTSVGAGSPQPAPKPSIWDFFRRLFGF